MSEGHASEQRPINGSDSYTPVGTRSQTRCTRRTLCSALAIAIGAIIVIALLSVVVKQTNVFGDRSATWILYTTEVPFGTVSKAAYISWTNASVLHMVGIDESAIDFNVNVATFLNAGKVTLTAVYLPFDDKCPAHALTSPVWLFVAPVDTPAATFESYTLCFV